MKRIALVVIGLSLLAGGFNSCKKGPNDPALSLKSRKARLAGEWTLVSAEDSDVQRYQATVFKGIDPVTGEPIEEDDVVTYTSKGTFDGVTYRQTTNREYQKNSNLNTTYEDGYAQTLSYTFEKDGTFNLKYTAVEDGETITQEAEGKWIFLDKNKSLDLSSKEAIMLSFSKLTFTGDGETEIDNYTGLAADQLLMIDQLKSKELVLKMESGHEYKDNSGMSKASWTLKAK